MSFIGFPSGDATPPLPPAHKNVETNGKNKDKLGDISKSLLDESKEKEKEVGLKEKTTYFPKTKENTDVIIKSLEAALLGSESELVNWKNSYGNSGTLSSLSNIELIRLTPLLLKARERVPNIVDDVPSLSEFLDALLNHPTENGEEAFKFFMENVKLLKLSHEEEMALLAEYIEYKKLSLRDLKGLSDLDWALLGNHLRYLDLRDLDLINIEYFFEYCSKITYLYINNPEIVEIPELLHCKVFDSSNCKKLKHLPYLPEVEIVKCNNCESLTIGKSPSLWNKIYTVFQETIFAQIEPESLPKCKKFECQNCHFKQLPKLPICEEVDCRGNKELKWMPRLDNCKKLICSDTDISELPALLLCEFLDAGNCVNLIKLSSLPVCKFIDITGCIKIIRIPDLLFCETFYADDCLNLTQIGALPNCKRIACKKCPITQLPDLLVCIYLDCEDCKKLQQLPLLPACLYLNCTGCNLIHVLPEVPINAQVYSSGTPAGDFNKFIIAREDFAKNPKKILLRLGRDYLINGNPFPNVYFTFKGKVSEAIDVGGLRRDCISSLCENLFQGKEENYLTMEDGIPEQKDPSDRDCYRTIGAIMTLCSAENSHFKTGPLFSEKVYEIGLKRMNAKNKEEIDDWCLTGYLNFLNVPDYVYTIVNLKEDMPPLDNTKLEYLSYLLDPLGMTTLKKDYFENPQNRNEFRNKLLQEARNDPRIKAISSIMITIIQNAPDDLWQNLGKLNAKTFMDRVQGQLNADIVLQKLKCEKAGTMSDDDFNKTESYLINWIKKADENTLRLFVRSVTANNTIGKDEIVAEVYNREKQFIPVAHTCFFTLELSGNCPTQEWFDDRMYMFLIHAMAGSAFQII